VAISITRSHTIGLSAAFRDAHHVDAYRFVVLYVDRENQLIIALRFTNDNREQNGFPIQKTGSVPTRLFFRAFDIDVNKVAGQYEPVRRPARELGIDESGEVFVIDLRARIG
jgi:hypothetical protein